MSLAAMGSVVSQPAVTVGRAPMEAAGLAWATAYRDMLIKPAWINYFFNLESKDFQRTGPQTVNGCRLWKPSFYF